MIGLLEGESFAALLASVGRFAGVKPRMFPQVLFGGEQFPADGTFVFFRLMRADVLLQILLLKLNHASHQFKRINRLLLVIPF